MKKALTYIDKHKKQIFDLADALWTHPELGYKEFKTKKILTDYLKSNGFTIENECVETAFTVSLGSGHPHIGLVAEMDALPTLGQKHANKEDLAAHSCGHFSQCVIMCAAITALKEENFKGKITLFFTPAEEYTDIAYRRQLIKQGRIKYVGGKINLLEKGIFDDVDLIIHCHAMSEGPYDFSVNSNLAGFIYKEITFLGKAAHAAVTPHLGVNALNACTLFLDAVGMLRETFREQDSIRFHGFISNGGQTVNSIPEKVVYECYVRAMKQEPLLKTAKMIDEAAIHSAKAIGARARIKNSPGYLPLIPDPIISDTIFKVMHDYAEDARIKNGEDSMAAGDIGDVSVFKPTVQFGYGGFSGAPHSKLFEVKDPELVFIKTAKVVVSSVLELLDHPETVKKIKAGFKPRMSKQEYQNYIDQK